MIYSIPRSQATIGLLCMMAVAVTFIGGGVEIQTLLVLALAIGLLAAFVRLTGTRSFRRDLTTFLLVLGPLTILYLLNTSNWGKASLNTETWVISSRGLIEAGFFSNPLQSVLGPVYNIGPAYVYGIVLILGGDNVYAIVVIQALFIVFAAILAYKIAEQVLDVQTARLTYWLVALHLDLLLASSLVFRDSIVVFLIVAGFYASLRFFIDGRKSHGMWLVLILMATYFVRGSLVFGLAAICLGAALLALSSGRRYVSATLGFAVLGILLVGALFLPYTNDPRAVGFMNIVLSGGTSLESSPGAFPFKEVSVTRDFLGAHFTLQAWYMWPFWVTAYWTYGISLIGSQTVLPLVGIIENIVGVIHLMLIPFILVGGYLVVRQRRPSTMLIILAALILATGVIMSGPFVIGRYRLMFMPFFLMMAAYALVHMKMRERVQVIVIMPLAGVAFFTTFVLLKELLADLPF